MLRSGKEVVATIPQDALLSFAVAQAVAFSGAKQIEASNRLWGRPLQEATLLLVAVFLPASYSVFHFWPDWSWLYFVDTQTAPRGWTVAAFAGILASGFAGFFLARWFVLRGRRRWILGTVGIALLGVVGIAAAFSERFVRLGTIDSFRAGRAALIYEVGPFAAHMAVVVVFLAGGLLVVLWGHRRRPPRER